MKKNEREIYQKRLFTYLKFYWLLHLLLFIFFLGFERGWGGFVYLWIFWFHLPVFLLASLLALRARKASWTKGWWTILAFFVLSNLGWVYDWLTREVNWSFYPFMLLTALPIWFSWRLSREKC